MNKEKTMRRIIRMFVLAVVAASATAVFAFDRVRSMFPSTLRPTGRHFRQAHIRWNLSRTTTLLRFPAKPTRKCLLRESLLPQNLASL
jgi:hypothetical protein